VYTCIVDKQVPLEESEDELQMMTIEIHIFTNKCNMKSLPPKLNEQKYVAITIK
jgi:hypothetical protein